MEDQRRMLSNGFLNEIRDKLRSFLNLFKLENDYKKLDKVRKYYQDLGKNPPKINRKIKWKFYNNLLL